MAGAWTLVLALAQSFVNIVGGFDLVVPYLICCAFVGTAIGLAGDRPSRPLVSGLVVVALLGLICFLVASGYPDGAPALVSSVLAREKPGFIYLPTYLSRFIRPEFLSTALFVFIFGAVTRIMMDAARSVRDSGNASLSSLSGAAAGFIVLCLANETGLPALYLIIPALVLISYGRAGHRAVQIAFVVMASLVLAAVTLTQSSYSQKADTTRTRLLRVAPETRFYAGDSYSAHLLSTAAEPLAVLILKNNLFDTLSVDPLMNPASVRYFRRKVLNFDPAFLTLPYQVGLEPGDALVLRAGAGNEVAAALLAGARSVTAVDERGFLAGMADWTVNSPYKAPGVELVEDDPRRFLYRSKKKFDLIVIGERLPSRQPDLLYTQETFYLARSRLKEKGKLLVSCTDPEIMCQTYRQLIETRLYVPAEGPYATKYGAFMVLEPNYNSDVALPEDESEAEAAPVASTSGSEPGKIDMAPMCRQPLPFGRMLTNERSVAFSSGRPSKLESYLYTLMIAVLMTAVFRVCPVEGIRSINRHHIMAFLLGFLFSFEVMLCQFDAVIMLGDTGPVRLLSTVLFWSLLPGLYLARGAVSRLGPLVVLATALIFLAAQSLASFGIVLDPGLAGLGVLILSGAMLSLGAALVHERLGATSMTALFMGMGMAVALNRLPLQIGVRAATFVAVLVLVVLIGRWIALGRSSVSAVASDLAKT
ncbi:MAG: hypothetical protein KC777_14280 [Cyanobacteria bacterium HKST-UBA02]|nr:hypothetical protein [Cyanobacteria bacterium HKST-UBA02]